MHELRRTARHAAPVWLRLWWLCLWFAAGCGDGGNPARHEPASFAPAAKFAGVNLHVSRQLSDVALDALEDHGVSWIALVPFGWQPRWDVPEVRLRTTGVHWGETDAGLIEVMRRARERGLRTLLKPHIWLVDEVPGQWRGTVGFDSEADWAAWEADYRTFILHYASLAAAEGADLFSVGVELQRAAVSRPAFWRDLIDSVRTVYHGPLTYGANWDGEVAAVSFWDRLDYIGVHAYFPLTTHADAGVDELVAGWRPHRQRLEALCVRWERPVVFTEVGYRSISGAAVRPWDYQVQAPVDEGAQADAYEALFRVFWSRDWFAGLFLWEWDAELAPDADLRADDGYTPQTKSSAAVLTQWFGGRG